jgi:hypothetical protein
MYCDTFPVPLIISIKQLLRNPLIVDLPHAKPPVLSQPDNDDDDDDDDYDGTQNPAMDNFDIDQVQPVAVEGIITARKRQLSGVCIHCIVGLVDQCQLMFDFNSKGVHPRPLNQNGQPRVPPRQTLMKFGGHCERKKPLPRRQSTIFASL